MWYRVAKLIHVCRNNSEHPNAPYWANGKWFHGLSALDIGALCPYCEATLEDPNNINHYLTNIIVTYIQKHLNIPIQYMGIYVGKVDKRKKEFKDAG